MSSISHHNETRDAFSDTNPLESNRSKVQNFGLKGNLVNNGRCPMCTLKPPCKHFASMDELPAPVEAKRSAKPPLPIMADKPKQSDHALNNLLSAGQDPIT